MTHGTPPPSRAVGRQALGRDLGPELARRPVDREHRLTTTRACAPVDVTGAAREPA